MGILTRLLNNGGSRIARRYYEDARENEGERVVYGINIVGPNRFRDAVTEAIAELAACDQFGHRLVQRYLHAVVAVDARLDFGFVIGVCFEPSTTAGGLRWHPNRFAGILLRTAVYTRLVQGFDICVWRNPKAQLPALRRELRWLYRADCDRAYITQQEQFIHMKASQLC
jgi:hypothetical protein